MICYESKRRIKFACAAICISVVFAYIIIIISGNVFSCKRMTISPNEISGTHDIEWIGDKKSFITLSDDSYMWVDFDTPIDIRRLVINFDNHIKNDWVLQVYYDIDNTGMNEDNSIIKRVSEKDDRVVLNINLSRITSLRIDWGTEAGNNFTLVNFDANVFDIKADITLFLFAFVMFLLINIINLWFDLGVGDSFRHAILREILKNAVATVLFWGIYFLKELRINNKYNMVLGIMLLCLSIVNIVDYWIFNLRNNTCQKVHSLEQLESILGKMKIIVISIIFFLLAFYDTSLSFIWDTCNNLLPVFLALGLFLFSIEFRMIKNRAVAVILLIMQIAMVIDFWVHGEGMIYCTCAFYLFAALAYEVNEKKIGIIFWGISVFSVLFTYIMAATNIYSYVIRVGDEALKRALGYSDPNVTSIHFFTIIMLAIYIINSKKRIGLVENLIISLIGIGVINFTGGRTSIIGVYYILAITLAFLVYSFAPIKIKFVFEKFRILSFIYVQGVLAFSFFGSVFYSWIYDKNWNSIPMKILGLLFNTRTLGLRFEKTNYAIHNYRLSLWGQDIPVIIDGKDAFIENYYINSLFNDGLLLLLGFFLLASIMNYRLWKKKQYFCMLILSSISIVTISESIAINPINNPLTFLAFSKIDEDENPSFARKSDYFNPIVITLFSFLWILALPTIIAFFKTAFEVFSLNNKSAVLIIAISIGVGFSISKLFYGILNEIILHKNIRKRNVLKLIGATCVVICSVMLGTTIIKEENKKNESDFNMEIPILEQIVDNTTGSIYSDKMPLFYNSMVKNIRLSYLHANELAYKNNITVLTNVGDNRLDYFSNGFLYMPISESSAIYTNDAEVINYLENNGYHLYGFHNFANKVDMQYIASVNGLNMTNKGGVSLAAKNETLEKGPYLNLDSGKYTVSYELHVDGLSSDNNAELAIVSVSNSWGQNVLGQKVITSDMFDQNGDCTCEIQINGSGSGYEFKAAPLSDTIIEVESITYRKTPDFDTHIKVDDSWRKIHEEYYGLDGQQFEQPDGYFGINFEYDEAGNISSKTFLNSEMEPVIISKGYSCVKMEYNDNKKVVREEYCDVEGKPILLENGCAAVEYEYDEAGKCIAECYYDVDGNPALYNNLYYCVKRIYNEKNQIIHEEFFGTDDEPIALASGAYGYNKEYDDKGNLITIAFLDADGELTTNVWGYAIVRRIFNDLNQIIREDYYDENDSPVIFAEGWSSVEYEYDSAGNNTIERYYDVNNNPVLYGGQFWYVSLTYNEKKQLIQKEFYGLDGKLTIRSEGYSSIDFIYDEAGNIIKKIYNDIDGSVVREE
ncbi:O-antigen ligase [Butyrivibrio proteoclasticus]|uniref:O-antigen ligase n=1 Tax=Butyrivibrio proteoclasticus TaxID=43305 RepID=A0A1I5PVJ9_9FIRM|nr:hypothetical protein [Butyrivibrio proteoclasticus]SFP38113.1 O-antigen ligase [Butyrivibrio proteoclasticus]